MRLPVNFEHFTKNPIGVIAFLALIVIGYLYIDSQRIHESQLRTIEETCLQRIDDHKERIESLESTIVKYEDRLVEMNNKLLECLDATNN